MTGLVVVLAAAAGAVLMHLAARRTARARGLARLSRRIADTPDPAVVARFSGLVLAANPALRALAGGLPATIETMLDRCLGRAGPAAVYRLSRAARSYGFGFLPVRLRDGESRYLAVWCSQNDLLVWSLVPSETMARMPPGLLASPYEGAPFAHMRQSGPEPPVANAMFLTLFGPDPAPVLAALPDRSFTEGDRVLLTARDGRVRVFRAFLASDPEAEERELFLFPIAADRTAATGPTGVLELVPVALAQVETDGTILWCNSRARALLGPEARPGAALEDLLTPHGLVPGPPGTGAPLGVEGAAGRSQMVQRRGADTFLQLTLTRVRLYERETLMAVLTDASQLRQLEDQFAQSQKMEAVGKLAGGVAHDFNNVLTAIVGHCDLLLLRKDPSHPDYSDLMQITQNANRAATLVRQLLAFSRKQTLNPETLSLQDVVSETHYLLDRLVGEAVTLVLDMAPGLWPVRADHQQLEQVLMNLVVNARDAMQGVGTVTIGVRNVTIRPQPGAEAHGTEGEHVEISVRDTGPGLDPSVIGKVFDPFFTTKPKGEGTGLGLSTVYGIVKQSGGSIHAGNAPDGGALFRILLPRASETGEATARRECPPPRRDLTGRGSVLLVEDEDPVRSFAARALKLRGYQVAEAANAEEAMAILEDRDVSVDLLVSDVVMPGMDGPTFAAKARRVRPGLRLIFVSGYAEESFRKNLTETDFLFLPKPFSLNELTAKVKEALDDAAA